VPIYTDNKTKRLYIEFQYKGHRYKERLPEGTTKKDAERIEVKVKSDLMFQSHGIETQASVVTFRHFVEYTFGHVADNFPKQRREHTARIVKAAYVFFRDKPMRSIKAADIERFKLSRINLETMHKTPRKPATVEREMSILSSIFSMAVKNDVIDYNPCGRVKKLQFDNVQNRLLRREDEQKFFDHLPSEWSRDVCSMALYSGLRQNDIMNLTPFHVRLDENCIRLTQGKTKRQVVVMLNSITREILERRMAKGVNLLFASPKTGRADGSVRSVMQRACIKAKIPVITIRDLRRTNATRKIEAGADLVTVAQSLGHTGVRMMPRYVRSLDAMQKAADSMVETGNVRHLPASAKNRKL